MSLQIICFKLNREQIKSIDDLIYKKLYFSRSEILRFAIRHLLAKIAQDITYEPGFTSWSDDIKALGNERPITTKESVSSKFPPKLLECVDQVVSEGRFQSRSQFIRESLDIFLFDREKLHESL
ncbi:MAG: putative nickel-responsive regulator [Candidatus Heimdallarchaeota archaeon LC_3]|nr:MAG: putative nickel-responsive regulator [Candidatus Heimdallarchaeota archaeon LC_3]